MMRVFVADNSDLLRRRLVNLLSEFPGIEVIGEAYDAQEALRAILETRPEVVTLDIEMRGGGGIALLREIKQNEQAPIVVVLTDRVSAPYRKQCMDAGADFFLDKATELKRVREIFQDLVRLPGQPPRETGAIHKD
jgi:DNA-binding NarL/FixJ family response regulator